MKENCGAETVIIAISRVLSIALHVFNLFTYQNVLYRFYRLVRCVFVISNYCRPKARLL